MPQPCIVSTNTVNLTANGAPAVLQADLRIAGAPNQIVVAADGVAVYRDAIRQERSTNTGLIAMSTPTPVTWDYERYRTTGWVGAPLSGSAFALGTQRPGLWLVQSGLQWDASTNSGSEFLVRLVVNGNVGGPIALGQQYGMAGKIPYVLASGVFKFALGDYVEAYASQADVAGGRLVSAGSQSFIACTYLGSGV